MPGRIQPRASELRQLTQQFFRRFGVLAAGATPCGRPLPLAHAHALMVLLDRGELTQRALGLALCIDKSNVARLCGRMAGAGHVTQVRCPLDGRSRRVALTPRGERVAREVEAASRARFSNLLRTIPPGRRESVISGVRALLEALDQMGQEQ